MIKTESIRIQKYLHVFSAAKSSNEADYLKFLEEMGLMITNINGPEGQTKPDKVIILSFGTDEAYKNIIETKNPFV